MTNQDAIELDADLVIFLQPGADGARESTKPLAILKGLELITDSAGLAEDFVELDSQRSTSLLDGVSLGSLPPGSTTRKTLYLTATSGIPGTRTIEVTVRAAPKPATETDMSLLPAPTESTFSSTIAVAAPFTAHFETQVYKGRRRTPVSTTDEWVDASEAVLLSTLRANGPWNIEIGSICLLDNVGDFFAIKRPQLSVLTISTSCSHVRRPASCPPRSATRQRKTRHCKRSVRRFPCL